MTSYPGESGGDVTTASTGGMTVGLQVLSSGANDLLLNRGHRLEPMRQLHVKGNVGWIRQHILVRLVAQENRVAINEAEELS